MANETWISGETAEKLIGIPRNRITKLPGVEIRARGVGFQVKRSTLPKGIKLAIKVAPKVKSTAKAKSKVKAKARA